MRKQINLNAGQLLPVQIAKHITNLIISRVSPGEKLPTEPELVSMFGVSRPTIREAIKILVVRSVVEIIRGKGTFVCRTPGLLEDPLGLRFIQDKDLVVFLQETRLAIEPGVAYLAAQRSHSADLRKIHRILDSMKINTETGRLDLDDELGFHASMIEATHNPVLQRLIPLITESVASTYMETRELYSSHRKATMAHREVLEAMDRHDPHLAQEKMKKHLEEALSELKKTIAAKKTETPVDHDQQG